MKINLGRSVLMTALLGGAATAAAPRARADGGIPPGQDSEWIETKGPASSQTPETTIRDWPPLARAQARAMIEKYGEPQAFGPRALVWRRNEPWDVTAVFNHTWVHSEANQDKDFLKQAIGYVVPQDKADELRRFDPRLTFNLDTNELAFQSDSEATNFLALNLADEIITGRRSVENARDFFRKTEALEMSGKSSNYLNGFLFTPTVEVIIIPMSYQGAPE
jgi:hypothetical protein